MKASSHSYEFDSQEVLDVCMWYTDVRKARVDQEREEMIERLITRPKRWWQFWRTKYTRESAIDYLKKQWRHVLFSLAGTRNTRESLV